MAISTIQLACGLVLVGSVAAAALLFPVLADKSSGTGQSNAPPLTPVWKLQVVDGGITVLQPLEWMGLEFPLLPYLEGGESSARGTWFVLLWDSQCPDCSHAIESLEQLAGEETLASQVHFATVDITKVHSHFASGEAAEIVTMSLGNTTTWVTMSPTLMLVRDGTVEAVWEDEMPLPDTLLQNLQ